MASINFPGGDSDSSWALIARKMVNVTDRSTFAGPTRMKMPQKPTKVIGAVIEASQKAPALENRSENDTAETTPATAAEARARATSRQSTFPSQRILAAAT